MVQPTNPQNPQIQETGAKLKAMIAMQTVVDANEPCQRDTFYKVEKGCLRHQKSRYASINIQSKRFDCDDWKLHFCCDKLICKRKKRRKQRKLSPLIIKFFLKQSKKNKGKYTANCENHWPRNQKLNHV